jgi:hypothetical protein
MHASKLTKELLRFAKAINLGRVNPSQPRVKKCLKMACRGIARPGRVIRKQKIMDAEAL